MSMRRLTALLATCVTWIVVIFLAFPLLWLVSTAFKPQAELFAMPPGLFPAHPTWHNFIQVLTATQFPTYFANSVIVAIATTAITVAVAATGAYGLVAFRFPGRALVSQALLFSYLLPASVLLIPIYLVIAQLGLTNTLAGLVIAYVTFMLPFAVWLMRSFLAALPVELEAAARIDGASPFGVFVDIVLPQAVPGLITTAVFSFILSWNEYLYALVVISRDARKTLPPGVMTTLVTGYNVEWGMVMAASIMMSLPLLAAFVLLQRHLVRGFGAGAVKG